MAKKDSEKLTLKQEIFVNEYVLNGGNATQAAIKAGYSSKSANEISYQMLQKTSVSAAINKLREHIQERYRLDIDKVVRQLIDIAMLDPMEFVEYKGGSYTLRKGIKKGELKAANFTIYPEYQSKEDKKKGINRVRMTIMSGDKKGSLELLGKYLNMWKDKDAGTDAGNDGNSETPLQRIQRIVRERANKNGQGSSDNSEGSNGS